jgi:hypothetical protein
MVVRSTLHLLSVLMLMVELSSFDRLNWLVEWIVMMAEVCAYFFPRLVELHNYSKTNSVTQRQYNWNTLNRMPHIILSSIYSRTHT